MKGSAFFDQKDLVYNDWANSVFSDMREMKEKVIKWIKEQKPIRCAETRKQRNNCHNPGGSTPGESSRPSLSRYLHFASSVQVFPM